MSLNIMNIEIKDVFYFMGFSSVGYTYKQLSHFAEDLPLAEAFLLFASLLPAEVSFPS